MIKNSFVLIIQKNFLLFKASEGVEQKKYESHAEKSCLTNEWATRIGNAGILVCIT